jgi:uncharacterized protein YqfB (UPF0267 family)
MQTAIINYSYNWNKKLDCQAFTTIRLRQDKKYQVGTTYQVQLNNKALCWVKIIAIKHFKLIHLNDFMAFIDTGYNCQETIKIIQKMYPNKDWNTQQLSFILQQKIAAPAAQATLIGA